MSRAVMGVVVAVIIAVLTAAAYFIATSQLESKIREDVRARVAKAQDLLIQNASLEMLGLLKRTEELSRDERLVRAMDPELGDPEQAKLSFQDFRQGLARGEARPDLLSLVDKEGKVIYLVSGDEMVPRPEPDLFKDNSGELKYPAIGLALGSTNEKRQAIAEIWDYQGPMKAAVAPVVDPDFGEVVGAVIVAYAISDTEAIEQKKLLLAEVAYFYDERVEAKSLGGDATEKGLAKPLFEQGLAEEALGERGIAEIVGFELGGEEYLATAGRLPRFPRFPLPEGYPAPKAGAMVTMSVTEALSPLTSVKLAILLLGVGALVISLLVMVVTSKSILGPIDDIEVGINEIINGKIDRTFRPGSSDTEGLANALNVMLARLLGRPEPGEEEYDEEGNIMQSAQLEIESEGLSPKDAEALELAREPEEAYFQRVYEEYVAARKKTGEDVEGITRDGFTAKLRLNEANLKSKYECRSVRFKVVEKDGKVTLKPVPIA